MAPVAPVAPINPVAPVAPVGPVAPVTPCNPCIPCGPLAPCAPVGPVVLPQYIHLATLKIQLELLLQLMRFPGYNKLVITNCVEFNILDIL